MPFPLAGPSTEPGKKILPFPDSPAAGHVYVTQFCPVRGGVLRDLERY